MSHGETIKPLEGDPYEKRDVSMGWIIAATAVCVVTVVASVIMLDLYFDYYAGKLHQEVVVERGHRLDKQVKESAAGALAGESQDGVKRIPIEKAIEAISDDN